MSILAKKRTTESYEDKLDSIPQNTRENVQATINNLKKFTVEKHQSTPDQVCRELIEIKKSKGDEEYDDILYDFLQDWIGWNISKKSWCLYNKDKIQHNKIIPLSYGNQNQPTRY